MQFTVYELKKYFTPSMTFIMQNITISLARIFLDFNRIVCSHGSQLSKTENSMDKQHQTSVFCFGRKKLRREANKFVIKCVS